MNCQIDKVDDIIVGIDLGTTNSCVSIWKDNNLFVIPDEKQNKIIPSYVGFTNVHRYVGIDAKNQSVINANNVYYEVKRLIGLKYSDPSVQKEMKLLSYEIIPDLNDNIKLKSTINNNSDNLDVCQSFTPEEISSNILMKLKHMASSYLKTDVKKAVITIPARFTDSQRQATYDAARIAGLDVVRMIHEPTAAAIAYGLINRKLKENEIINVIVYDFGGGTLDVSIVEISVSESGENIFTVLGSAGNTHLGGMDFDNKLVDFCIKKFKKINKIDKLNDLPSISLQKLKQSCENAKKILSNKNKTYIAVKEFYNKIDLIFPITRNDFEIICADLLLICLKPIDDVLDCCDLSIDQVNEIIMVGGMTRMPCLLNRIEMKFHKKPNTSLNPDEAISAGAAIQAYMLSNSDNPFSESMTLLDICPLSLGVETIGSIMDIIIDRNTIIPTEAIKLYTTNTDYDTSVLIKIYEGERKMTSDNIFVGEFELTNIPSAPRGIPEIEVKFNVDINGILTVTAEELESHEKSSIIVNTNKGRLSEQEILRLIDEAKEYETRDELERIKKMYYYQIDDLCSNIKLNINNKNYKLNQIDKTNISNNVDQIIDWLKQKKYYDRHIDELENMCEDIKKKYGVLIVKGTYDDSNDNEIKSANNNNNNATSIYENDDDNVDNINNETIIKNIECDELGLSGLTDPEVSELKELRKLVFDLCYSIFDIINNNNFIIEDTHKTELKYFIDDCLLWLHVHEKPTKQDYKVKLDEINDSCDKIMKHYEDKNTNVFEQNALISKSKKDELENLCYSLMIIIKENKMPLKTIYIDLLNNEINDNITWLINNENVTEELCNERLNKLNDSCSEYYNKMQGIHIDKNIIYLDSNSDINNNNNNNQYETSIEDLLKQRQQDQLNQMLLDCD
jgi:molecular chaperone DnaK (HSP70)